jgi:hypothetical protein
VISQFNRLGIILWMVWDASNQPASLRVLKTALHIFSYLSTITAAKVIFASVMIQEQPSSSSSKILTSSPSRETNFDLSTTPPLSLRSESWIKESKRHLSFRQSWSWEAVVSVTVAFLIR